MSKNLVKSNTQHPEKLVIDESQAEYKSKIYIEIQEMLKRLDENQKKEVRNFIAYLRRKKLRVIYTQSRV